MVSVNKFIPIYNIVCCEKLALSFYLFVVQSLKALIRQK